MQRIERNSTNTPTIPGKVAESVCNKKWMTNLCNVNMQKYPIHGLFLSDSSIAMLP